MIRPLEVFIGLRYLRAGRGPGLVSFMSVASFLGIGLGVAALIVILSAMNGLAAESRSRLLSLSEHITVTAPAADWAGVAARLRAVDGVASVVPFVQLDAMLSSGARLEPAVVRGLDPLAEQPGSDLVDVVGPERLAELSAGGNRILLGRFLASNLGLQSGDRVTLWRARLDGGRLEPERTTFVVGGIFGAGVEAHDASLALVHIADAADLVGLDGRPEALGIRVDDPTAVARLQASLADTLGPGFEWSNWAVENRSLFQAMAIEKTMMTIVLLFIAAIAAFNIVASLTMVVNEKEKDIAILRTLGLERGKVTRVFLIQGAVIGVGGTLVGALTGLVLALNLETILPWLERTFGFQIMPGDVYYVTIVPSQIEAGDVALVTGLALAMALAATLYPSRRAGRVEPAEVLRYE